MTSTNYQIQWDTVGVGGSDTSSSATYVMRDAIGNLALGDASSSTYQLAPGYRQGVYDQVAAFAVYAQDRSTQVAATAISSTTITVTSTAGFSVGDFLAVVQDEGASQVSAIGQVTAVSSPNVTLDTLTTSGSTPTIDGTNDYVYELTGSTIALGSLSSSLVTTGIFAWEVTADVQQGYSVYVAENQDLQTASSDVLTDVADGTVTAGATEYGARSSDASVSGSTFDSQDTGITTTLQQVSTRADNSYSSRDFLTVKAAVSSSATGGSYSHTITVVYVGDY